MVIFLAQLATAHSVVRPTALKDVLLEILAVQRTVTAESAKFNAWCDQSLPIILDELLACPQVLHVVLEINNREALVGHPLASLHSFCI